MARSITIKASTDAYHWHTCYHAVLDDLDPESFTFPAIPCKQLLIEGDDLMVCENWGYVFSIASVEAYDSDGENAALFSKGVCVAASSVNSLAQNELESSWWYWPAHFDLGVKWSRVGYHEDPINWHWVEREKGRYEIDPECEKAIDMLYSCLLYTSYIKTGYPTPIDSPSYHMTLLVPNGNAEYPDQIHRLEAGNDGALQLTPAQPDSL